jgi:Ca-activated chloride channel family protein
LFSGQALTAATSDELLTSFVAQQDGLDGMIGYESSLLTLNASGKLHRPLELVYPRDGIVLADYPLLLLRSKAQGSYDRLLEWFRDPENQRLIMKTTLRRPYDPDVPRDPLLSTSIGSALDFPADKRVIDRLLADYADPATRVPGQVVFLLDYSLSMKGARAAALRQAFSGLGGDDDSSLGRFVRFYQGERITLVRFAGRVLAEKTFTVGEPGDMERLRAFVAADEFGEGTAVWSTLDHAYRTAAGITDRKVSIVVMTDGESNTGLSAAAFLTRPRPPAVPTFTVGFGDASRTDLAHVADVTGGRLVDAARTSLLDAFKEIRGCSQR